MKNKLFFVPLIFSIFVLAACGGQSTATSAPVNTPMSSSTSVSTAAPLSSTGVLDPALATDAASRSVISHVYEGLVSLDASGQPALTLASNGTVSEDGLDYIFTIRPSVTFHDGTALDADAVVTNFNRWLDPKDALHGSGTYDTWVADFGGFKGDTTSDGRPKSEVDGIQKQDTMTVIVHLNKLDADFLKKLADPAFSIVSPAALSAAGFGTSSGKDGGTGPYKLGTWTSSSLTLEPFSGYWNSTVIPTSNMQINIGQ
ncbi:MAG TPA: ABC transporter substrate-binding protein [Anaerolineales bacterium]|nr:ABC transporter substrate-binding protein [Anaerolineales bacterium]